MCITPVEPDVKARETPEMIGHAVAIRQVDAGPEADPAPLQLRVIRQGSREARLRDCLAEEAVDAIIEAI